MQKIKLTQNQFALVDDEDFDKLNKYKWWANKQANTFYAYTYICINKQKISMHNQIMNSKPIDHIDGNGLNNQKNNLRKCTNQQNQYNRRLGKNNTSEYKGVCLDTKKYKNKIYQSWRAKICFNNKTISLGNFKNKIDAAKAYNKKAIELFGEFANINIL